ncbi:hypothetical protein CEXT_758031 [Caerostris extrusa]|uniref:Uncharacterized protein n=1 Tax=Caerostris extrusa TaxID=172846 RepID=A0AAV4U7K7_CAEEX|nr:hypothetical protein CEXT_758031 [Caerostris extrusa]
MYKRCPATNRLRAERRRSERILPSSETTTNSGSRFKNLSPDLRGRGGRSSNERAPSSRLALSNRLRVERGGVSESFHHRKQRQTAEVALKIYPLLGGGGRSSNKRALSSRLALSSKAILYG